MASSETLGRRRGRPHLCSPGENGPGRPPRGSPIYSAGLYGHAASPTPVAPRRALGCRFLRGTGLRLGSTGSASTLRVSRLQSSLDATAWSLASPPKRRRLHLSFRPSGRPEQTSSMTTWADNQFPRPDFHRLVLRHYGLHTPDAFSGLSDASGRIRKDCRLSCERLGPRGELSSGCGSRLVLNC
jgi:hypothetical protein